MDIDPGCETVARSLNRTQVEQGRFEALTADMLDYDYAGWIGGAPALIINTSCEHITAFDNWFASIPEGTAMVLQSNDYFSCDEHVNCVPTLLAFEQQAPLSETYFRGQLGLKKYTRFMLIGRK